MTIRARFSAWALGALCPWIALGARASEDGDAEVRYFRSDFEFAGELLESAHIDLDSDGRLESIFAVRSAGGRRLLRIHRLGPSVWEPKPMHEVDVLDEAVAFSAAELRSEPGRELLFLTAGGAWSYSLTHAGYRGNARRLTDGALIYDVPSPSELPFWPYVMPAGPSQAGGDRVLLPGPDGFAVWGPREGGTDDGQADYRAVCHFRAGKVQDNQPLGSDGGAGVSIGNGGIRITQGAPANDPLLPGLGSNLHSFFQSARSFNSPAMVDIDGDGTRDLLLSDGEELSIHLGAGGLSSEPDRREALPEYLKRENVRIWFRDLDGDGDLDLLASCSDESSGLEASEVSVLALLNDGRRLLPEQPHQVLRFKTHELRVRPTDVNGDGRIDLALREYVLPSLVGAVTGVEIEISELLFLGTEGPRPFERKPILKATSTYDEVSILEGITNRKMVMDFDGDGIADWAEIDVKGRLTLRRTIREEHFFGDDTWSIEPSAWLRFEAFGDIESLEVFDINGDGLGDVLSRGRRGISYLLSQRVSPRGSKGGQAR